MLNQTEHDGINPFLEEVPDGASFIIVPTNSPTEPSPPNSLSARNPLNWKSLVTKKLATSNDIVVTIYTIIAAFSAYFSIYGITASLFAATFDGIKLFGNLDLKVAFSIAQLLGYAISKMAGAVLIPTIKREKRWRTLLTLAVMAIIPLILFGVLPPPGQVVMVFMMSVPMAWMWGIMVMYLEGRRTSEFLLMGLYLSVMVASGSAKSTARGVLQAGVPESWMPALVGSVSSCIFVFFVTLLDAIPDPSEEDKKVRSERRTMSSSEARKFLAKWAPGLVTVTLVYAVLTAFRNFRDYFAPEIWRDLDGANFNPSRFTQSEIPVGVCTAVAYSLLYWIKDNKKAFFSILGVMFLGGFVILGATLTHTSGMTNSLEWMVMVGVGLYMAYIPPGAMLYDRFNGATGQPFTSVFMIYLSDVCGYSVTLTILFYRSFGAHSSLRYVDFFHKLSFIASIACMFGMFVAFSYFFFAMRHLVPSVPHVPLEEVKACDLLPSEVKEQEMVVVKKGEEEQQEGGVERMVTFGVSVDNGATEKRREEEVDLINEPALGAVQVTAQAVYA